MTDSSMRAAQIKAHGQTEIVDTNLPQPAEGFALVEPLLIAICGSDLLKIFFLPDSVYPLPPGLTGHEVIGRVVSMNLGSEDPDTAVPQYPGGPVTEGDIVLALVPVAENAMSEFVTTTIDNLLPLPKGVPYPHLILAQQLGTVIYACRRLPNIIDKDVVVIGQGSAGLFFNTMLRRMGARKVIALDLTDARLAMGRTFGATAAFNNHEVDPIEAVATETGMQMADLVVEAVGEPETINLTPKLVKRWGHLLYFGVPHAMQVTFDIGHWYRMCLNTISVVGADQDPGKRCFFQALELISSGEVQVAPMITHTFSFEEVEKAYEIAHTREDGAGKVFVKMPAHDKYLGD